MPQWKLALLTIIALGCAIASFTSPYPGMGLVFLAPALLFGGLFYYKWSRDNNILREAETDLLAAPPAQPQIEEPIMNDLFVPDELDN